MARQIRQPANAPARKSVIKVTAAIEASLYVRMAAAAAERQVSHSRFVADAIDQAVRDSGLYVGKRRSAGGDDSPIVTVEESATDAA